MLTPEKQLAVVSGLSGRPGHEKVRALLLQLLVDGLGVDIHDVDFEKPAPEVRGRMDALLGRTVFELKSNLRRERQDAEQGLARYLTEREGQTGEKYVGIASDGADFIAFFLRGEGVVEVGSYRTDPEKPRELLAWLQCIVAVGDSLPPDPETIKREFGRKSLAARRALDELSELWALAGKTPEGRLKLELWNRLLSVAYEADVGDDNLFLQHTYLVVVAKAVAWEAVVATPPQNAAALLHGTAFSELGITGQSEPDFFDWVLRANGGAGLVMRIARQVNRFELRDIRVDILKALYESLIDPETRHDLGEYYTPDWLAARMVATAVETPLEQRVMDPACGSGTFLFYAVRSLLDAASGSGLSPEEAVRRAAEKVAGIDVHPVAVIFARVTYLLALMPALREGRPPSLALPVYLGDALQWNVSRLGSKGLQMSILEDAGKLEIFVPAVKIYEPEAKFLDAEMLTFPAAVASDAELFDRVLNAMIEFAARPRTAAEFAAWLERETPVSNDALDALRETYEVMCRLQGQGRNHVWGYVARNLARPVWLSGETQKADVVIGNPPWVAFRFMGGEFQRRFRRECRGAGLWVGGKVATQQDLSGYFYTRAALLYMRSNGRIAFVMPYATLSRQAYAKFRNGAVERSSNLEFRLRFTEAWTFDRGVWPLFPVPSCVLFAERRNRVAAAPLPGGVRGFEGILPKRDASEDEAAARLNEEASPWPTPATDEGGSPYRTAFRNGATLRAVIPWDRERVGLMDAVAAAGRGYPKLAAWLEQVEGLWGAHDKSGMSFIEQCDFYGKLSRQFPVAPIRVVYAASGTIPAACNVLDPAAVVEHALYWSEVESVEEARYLCGILNSEALRSRVQQYQTQGQWGARRFDKYVFNAPIPRFNAANVLHRDLAAAAQAAEQVADCISEREGEYFTTTRKRVREALRANGIASRLEDLAIQLLGGAG